MIRERLASAGELINSLFTGSERTRVVKRNITGSFAIKGLSIATSLFLVPLTIHLLTEVKYGIWITIFSIVSWFNMMDIGIGNGFRNKFAEAVAQGQRKLAQDYVQALYSFMALIAAGIFLIFSVTSPFLSWATILNLPPSFDENINLIIWMVFGLFCVQLYTKNISTILLSLQKTAYSNSLLFLGNVGALLFIIGLQQLEIASLFSVALAFMVAPILVFLVVSIISFKGSLAEFRPQIFALPKKAHLRDLVGLGVKFFFIQITTVVMFASTNIIITQLYGPAEVTPYNVAFRLFSSAQILFTIVITPFWSAFTEANAKQDFAWIKRSVRKLLMVWVLFSLGVLVIWGISPFIFKIWIGNEVYVPYALSFQLALFSILMTWLSIFVYYINSIGKIKLQLYIAIFQFIMTIPLALLLAEVFELGTPGIVLAINLNLLIPAVLIPLQYKKLISKEANGIWSK